MTSRLPRRQLLSTAGGLGAATALTASGTAAATGSGGRRRSAALVVHNARVTRVPVREISDTRVRLTLRGGRTVYDADSAAGRAVRAGMEAAARTDAAARTAPGARTGTGPGAGGAAARHAGCAHARGRGDRTAG
ncbi:hypothetical protein [Streptomyces sp. NPDC020141]|uniref:hypothetical protein n=1 Tax=Streptomyces sp. NPDC020141 TaxID=3365065 RepID=UPI00378A9FCB